MEKREEWRKGGFGGRCAAVSSRGGRLRPGCGLLAGPGKRHAALILELKRGGWRAKSTARKTETAKRHHAASGIGHHPEEIGHRRGIQRSHRVVGHHGRHESHHGGHHHPHIAESAKPHHGIAKGAESGLTPKRHHGSRCGKRKPSGRLGLAALGVGYRRPTRLGGLTGRRRAQCGSYHQRSAQYSDRRGGLRHAAMSDQYSRGNVRFRHYRHSFRSLSIPARASGQTTTFLCATIFEY